MNAYLEVSTYIDWQHPNVRAAASRLAASYRAEEYIVRACFEFVRDEVKHSWDYSLNPVTCVASDVLEHGTGYCYAKSHLLAALLRANNIPAGLCYQRLTIENDEPPYCLHGLNAVYLHAHGWYRIDPRGNKPGVNAAFHPPMEQLAFPIKTAGEADLPEIWPAPLGIVTDVLKRFDDFRTVADNLPDVAIALRHS